MSLTSRRIFIIIFVTMMSLSSLSIKMTIDNLNIEHHIHLETFSTDVEISNKGNAHDDEQCGLHHCHSNQHLITSSFLLESSFKSVLCVLNDLNIYISPLYSFFRPPISF
ncbi:hypothetical protein VSA01S_10060 [Vibrio sagamiensis NBRC 104589]|uniref:Uncharacterized protein n=1 Tax=Vibrio sagamiensis NBRC 104589 TaxID=1219064 RepID=A0A511QC65_9VIBR|nr:hypothetical protein VSA01S_10060 [Vibrio sagamiensis NBRC 104589]